MNNILRIIFVGSQKIGYKCLEKAIQMGYDIPAIFTIKPDEHEKWDISVDLLAKKYGIPLFLDTEFNEQKISKLKPDLILLAGFRSIIANELLRTPKYGIIGLHASLLPQYKGQAPLNWAIIKGEKNTGITLFRMNERIDEGEILGQKETQIDLNETIVEVKQRIIDLAVQLLEENLPLIEKGMDNKITPIEKGSYGCRRIPADGLIDWKKPSLEIYNLIRASEPSYAAFTFYNNKKIKILRAKISEDEMKYIGVPGQIGMILKDKSVVVITGDGHLIITDVQQENEEPVKASIIFRTSRIRLESLIHLGDSC